MTTKKTLNLKKPAKGGDDLLGETTEAKPENQPENQPEAKPEPVVKSEPKPTPTQKQSAKKYTGDTIRMEIVGDYGSTREVRLYGVSEREANQILVNECLCFKVRSAKDEDGVGYWSGTVYTPSTGAEVAGNEKLSALHQNLVAAMRACNKYHGSEV